MEMTNRLVDRIAEGFDIGIRTGQNTDTRLMATNIASRTLYTCAAPNYLQQTGRPKTVRYLDNMDCLTGTSSTWHFKVAGGERVYRPKGRWRCNNGAAVVDAAVAGMGVCQLPEFYILSSLASGSVERILEQFEPDDEPLWAVYPRRRHLLPKISQLVEALAIDLPLALQQDGSART
jgi:DNA-binding transcriptional LysR family regulator